MSTFTAKAAILHKEENIALSEIKYFSPEKDDVLLRIKYIGICGSDIKLYKGTYTGHHCYPLVIGHEWVGEVVETGNNVQRINVGDRVTGDCSVYCDNCTACLSDKNLCSHIQKRGITIDGFAREYAIVNEKYLYKVTEKLPDNIVSLTEPLAVVIEGVSKIPFQKIKNENVLIFGAGVIGLLSIITVLNAGASEVTVVEKNPFRAEMAKKIGAKEVIIGDIGKSKGYIENNFSFAIEAIGDYQALEQSLHSVRPGGIILCFGHIGKGKVNPAPIVEKALTIVGSIGGTGSFEKAFSILSEYRDKVENIITNIIPLEELPHRFPHLFNGDSENIKVLFQI